MSHLNFRNIVHLYECLKLYFHLNLPLSGLPAFVLQALPFFRVSIITLVVSIFPNDDSNEDRHAVSHLAGHLEHNHWSETKRVNCRTPQRRRYFNIKNTPQTNGTPRQNHSSYCTYWDFQENVFLVHPQNVQLLNVQLQDVQLPKVQITKHPHYQTSSYQRSRLPSVQIT
jgi:hypothetical protein